MKKTSCEICNKTDIPVNDSVKIDGQVYCINCIEANFKDQASLKNHLVEKQTDDTVCAFCSKDFGAQVLNTISIHPVCQDCETSIKNKTFPRWVKGFFAAIVLIVVLAIAVNWKYYAAYRSLKKSNESFASGDYVHAAKYMSVASETLPQVEDLQTLSQYYQGVNFLQQDKNEEAIAEFNKCVNSVPENFDVNRLIITARIGATFDKKDYQGFLQASKEYLAIDSSTAESWISLASAYACLYATNGKEEDRLNAYKNLDRAKLIDSTSDDIKMYINRIEHRIYTKNIITQSEFLKQFPNGWTKN